MAKNRIILVVIVCFSVAGFAGQPRQEKPPGGPRLKKSMTDAEKLKFFEPLFKDYPRETNYDGPCAVLYVDTNLLYSLGRTQIKNDPVEVVNWMKPLGTSVTIDEPGRRITRMRTTATMYTCWTYPLRHVVTSN